MQSIFYLNYEHKVVLVVFSRKTLIYLDDNPSITIFRQITVLATRHTESKMWNKKNANLLSLKTSDVITRFSYSMAYRAMDPKKINTTEKNKKYSVKKVTVVGCSLCNIIQWILICSWLF